MTDNLEWGESAVSYEEGMKVLDKSYGYALASDGVVHGLVAGDMGYDATHITIPEDHMDAFVEFSERYENLKVDYNRVRDKGNLYAAWASEVFETITEMKDSNELESDLGERLDNLLAKFEKGL